MRLVLVLFAVFSQNLRAIESPLAPEVYAAVVRVMDAYLARTSSSASVCTGRLTLSSGVPVTTSDVSAATSVYFTPFDGGWISLYSGTVWQLVSFSETSVAVPSTTTTPFDIFAYNNSGTLALETVSWTNDTTRATALTTQDGVRVKSGAATRRYLGTGRTTGVSGQTEDSKSKRFLWNMCNRVPRKLLALSSTASWNYTTQTWRPANNDTTTGTTRVEYLVGLSRENVELEVSVGRVANPSFSHSSIGIGINSTTANSAELRGFNASARSPRASTFYHYPPAVGYSYAQWLEFAQANSTTTWYGTDSAAGSLLASGMLGKIWN